MEYLVAWETLIHEKKRKSKISCQTPFKCIGRRMNIERNPSPFLWIVSRPHKWLFYRTVHYRRVLHTASGHDCSTVACAVFGHVCPTPACAAVSAASGRVCPTRSLCCLWTCHVLHQPVLQPELPLDVSVLQAACAAFGHVCPTPACAAVSAVSGRVCPTSSLCCLWTCLSYTSLWCSLSSLWTYLSYNKASGREKVLLFFRGQIFL